MTTDHLPTLHGWLTYALPATADELLYDLQTLHRALPKAYAGFPRDAKELADAMTELVKRGLVEKRDATFFWKAEPVKAEPQGVLFA